MSKLETPADKPIPQQPGELHMAHVLVHARSTGRHSRLPPVPREALPNLDYGCRDA